MCDITKYKENLTALVDFFDYVNTDIYGALTWEDEMYAAYATAFDLSTSTISQWYTDCDDAWVGSVDAYLADKYEIWREEDIQFYYEKEVDQGILRECAGYHFTQK